jgi:hypothetical protein
MMPAADSPPKRLITAYAAGGIGLPEITTAVRDRYRELIAAFRGTGEEAAA